MQRQVPGLELKFLKLKPWVCGNIALAQVLILGAPVKLISCNQRAIWPWRLFTKTHCTYLICLFIQFTLYIFLDTGWISKTDNFIHTLIQFQKISSAGPTCITRTFWKEGPLYSTLGNGKVKHISGKSDECANDEIACMWSIETGENRIPNIPPNSETTETEPSAKTE